jgi:transcriptional regulator with XRE-family HTH domain
MEAAKKLVGSNIRRLRVERGLTIETLAGDTDFAPAYLGEVERGRVNVGIVILERMAKVLGAKLADLVEPPPGAKPPKPLRAGRRPSKLKSRKR